MLEEEVYILYNIFTLNLALFFSHWHIIQVKVTDGAKAPSPPFLYSRFVLLMRFPSLARPYGACVLVRYGEREKGISCSPSLSRLNSGTNQTTIDIIHHKVYNHAMNNIFELPTLKCLRCGHYWYPKRPALPKVCPKCKSPYWNKPKWKGIKK